MLMMFIVWQKTKICRVVSLNLMVKGKQKKITEFVVCFCAEMLFFFLKLLLIWLTFD